MNKCKNTTEQIVELIKETRREIKAGKTMYNIHLDIAIQCLEKIEKIVKHG